MRTVSATALAKAQANDGVESIVVVELDTGDGKIYLGDRDLGGVEGRIKSFGNVTISLSDKGATVGSMNIELDDSDQYFLDLLCTTRFEGRTVRVLQVFDEDISDAVELMVGRVGSPVAWTEEERTFSFDIEAFYRASDDEIPYAPEQDSDLQEQAWNRVWPRIYGLPIDVPAVQVTFAPTGHLIKELQPLHDYFDMEVERNVEFPLGEQITVQVGNEWMTGEFEELEDDPVTVLRFWINERNVSKGVVYSKERGRLTFLEDAPTGFESWAVDPRYAAWDVGDEVLAGNWLWLIDTYELESGSVSVIGVPSTNSSQFGEVQVPSFVGYKNYILYQKGDATRGQLPWFAATGLYYIDQNARADIRGVLDVNDTLWGAGTVVEQITSTKYVVSDKPCDAVYRVRAWRTVKLDERGGNIRQLINVPEAFYTVRLNDTVDGVTCTTIELNRTLTSRNTGWDDTLYVTAKRGDGNVANILTEILEDSGFTVDAGTVEEDCEAYPMNFALLTRRQGLEFAYDVAWQGRCGVSVIGSTATIKYLSVRPTETIYSYSDDTVLEGMTQFTTTELGDVVNDMWVTWKKRYSQQDPERLHYRNDDSIQAYGRKKEDLEIYVYRHKRLVDKTATFWFNRKSRVWRKIRVVTDLDAIQVTPYDDVRSLLPELDIIAMNESVEHDTQNDSIAAMLWTPAEVGTCEVSDSAYLEDSGDVAPTVPSLSAGEDVAEEIEVSPLDLSYAQPEAHVGEATADEVEAGPIYGVFDAKLYKTNENSGEVVEIQVQVKNLNPGSPIKQGDVVTVFRAEDGTYYAAAGAAATSAYYGSVTDLLSGSDTHIECDIYTVTDDDYEFLETAQVFHLGSELPGVGDDIVVFRSAQGTYWTVSGSNVPPVGLARVRSDSADADAIPCALYQGTDFSGDGTNISVKVPALASSAKVSAGTWIIVMRFGGSWVGYLPLIRPRVPA